MRSLSRRPFPPLLTSSGPNTAPQLSCCSSAGRGDYGEREVLDRVARCQASIDWCAEPVGPRRFALYYRARSARRRGPGETDVLQLRNLTMDCGDPDRLAEFWEAALGYEKRSSDGQYTVLVHPDGGRPFLILQRVPEPKVGKNPLHLDLRADDREAEVRRLVGLGARSRDRPGIRPELDDPG